MFDITIDYKSLFEKLEKVSELLNWHTAPEIHSLQKKYSFYCLYLKKIGVCPSYPPSGLYLKGQVIHLAASLHLPYQ